MSDEPTRMPVVVSDNSEANRYEARVDGHVAFSEYERRPNYIVFTHTEVPDALEGRGVGSALVRHALDQARAEGQRVVPACPFFQSFIQRHPEYQELVSPVWRPR